MKSKSTFTGRTATFSFRHKWWVLGVWLLMLVASGVASSGLSKVLTTDQKDLSGSESRQATDVITEQYGKRPHTETLIVRSERFTVDEPAFQAAYGGLIERIKALPGVTAVATYASTGDPNMVSRDRHAAIAAVMLTGDIKESEKNVVAVIDAVKAARVDGFETHTIGDASANRELNAIAESDMQSAEQFGLPVALFVMVLAFGTVIAAGVPLLLGLAAIGMAIGSIALIGRAFELSFFVTNVVSVIGLAVGIDYSLFIIGRYREEMRRGRPRIEAIGIAADTSGRAVFFSGITVLLALAGMLIVRSNIFISIGIGAIVVVIYAVMASLTLLPAMLGIIGRGINWLSVPFLGKAGYGTKFWTAVTHRVQRHPVWFVAGAAGLLVAAALPLATIKLGFNGSDTLPKQTETYQAVQALRRDFSSGRTEPIQIVVKGDVAGPQVQGAIARLRTAVEQSTDFQWMDVIPDASGQTAIVEVTAVNAVTSDAARAVTAELRERLVPQAFQGTHATVLVGGNLAILTDVQHEMNTRLPIVFGFVLGLSFVLLLLVFRSIAIPAKAILLNLLSVGASYGLLVVVFQHGVLADVLGFEQTPQIETWLPLFLFSILFGLSMDYHVFLLSRVKEEYTRTGNNKLAVAHGVESTAGMITSAAVIMVAVFAAFARGQIVSFQQMGFGLATAVFIDATIIRSVLVPASMQLLGRYNWWFPSWLEWLPCLSIEGGTPHHVDERPATAAAALATGD